MLRLLARAVIVLLANTIGLLAAMLLLPGFSINILGFVVSVVFFTTVEILFEPFIIKVALKYMPALRGGIALVTTFVGLLLTNIFTSGLNITGITTWVLAPLVIWAAIVFAGALLPLVVFTNILSDRTDVANAARKTRSHENK